MSNFARDHCRLMAWKKKPLKISLCPTQYQCTAASVTSAVRKQELNTTTLHDFAQERRHGVDQGGRKTGANKRTEEQYEPQRTELQLLNNSLRFLRVMLQCFSQWIQWTIIRIIFQEDKTCFFLFITLIQGKNGVKYIKMAVRVILSFLKLNQAKLVKKSNKSC